MKKFSFLLTIFVLLTAFTCENEALDDNVEINNTSSLNGIWTLISFEADITSLSNFDGQEFSINILAEGSNYDYDLTFFDSNYTVSGSYDLTSTTYLNGEINDTSTSSYTNVSGGGNYSVNGNLITVEGAFFELDFEGIDTSGQQEVQTAEYQVSADGQTLTFNQNEEQTQNTNGIDVTTSIISTSIWQRVN